MSEPAWMKKLPTMEKSERDEFLIKRFYAYDKRFLHSDPAIRGGEVCLRGTRLTVSDVISIADNNELDSYPEITDAHIHICRVHAADKALTVNAIVQYDAPLHFHVSKTEWNNISFENKEDNDLTGSSK